MAVTAWRTRQIRILSDNTSLQAGTAGVGTYLDLIFTAVPPLSEEFARTGATAARGARCGAAVRAGRVARWVTPLPPIVTTRTTTLSKTLQQNVSQPYNFSLILAQFFNATAGWNGCQVCEGNFAVFAELTAHVPSSLTIIAVFTTSE